VARQLSTLLAVGVLALSGLVPGCPGELENPSRFEGCPPGFNVEQEIFQKTCNDKLCHTSDDPAGELDLESPNAASRLVNVPSSNALCLGTLRLDPNNVDNSLLMQKLLLSKPGCGDRMPLEPNEPLSDSQIECVRQWAINAAAKYDGGAIGTGGSAGSASGGSGGASGGSAGASGSSSGGASSDAATD
jgi:hypothetical protein